MNDSLLPQKVQNYANAKLDIIRFERLTKMKKKMFLYVRFDSMQSTKFFAAKNEWFNLVPKIGCRNVELNINISRDYL